MIDPLLKRGHDVTRKFEEEHAYDCIVPVHWETAVTKKSVVFVPLYTLCGKVQNCTEGLQVM